MRIRLENIMLVLPFALILLFLIFGAIGLIRLINRYENGKNNINYSKYQIWLGNASISTGYCVDHYEIVGDVIKFQRSQDGVIVLSSLNQVFKIEQTFCGY